MNLSARNHLLFVYEGEFHASCRGRVFFSLLRKVQECSGSIGVDGINVHDIRIHERMGYHRPRYNRIACFHQDPSDGPSPD